MLKKSVLASLALTTGWVCHAGTVYDSNAQFDANNNPSATGGWSYGSKPTLGGVFTLFPAKLTNNPAFNGWTVSPQVVYPDIAKNISGAVYTDPEGGLVPKDALTLAPGQGSTAGLFAVIRWSAPATGQYAIDSTFTGVWDHADSLGDVHVVMNGISIFDGSINMQSSTRFSGTNNLVAGDVVEFAVGQGSPNVWARSILTATISAVPVPAAVWLFGSALAGLIGFGRRKRAVGCGEERTASIA